MHVAQTPQSAGDDDELLIPVRKACARLNCGRSKFYKLVRLGRLKLVTFEGRSAVPAASLKAYIDGLKPGGARQAA